MDLMKHVTLPYAKNIPLKKQYALKSCFSFGRVMNVQIRLRRLKETKMFCFEDVSRKDFCIHKAKSGRIHPGLSESSASCSFIGGKGAHAHRRSSGRNQNVSSIFFGKELESGTDLGNAKFLLLSLRFLLLSHVQKNPILITLWKNRSWLLKHVDEYCVTENPMISYLGEAPNSNRLVQLCTSPYLAWTLFLAALWGMWKFLWTSKIYNGLICPPNLSLGGLLDCLLWLGLLWSSLVLVLWIVKTAILLVCKVAEAPVVNRLRFHSSVIAKLGSKHELPETMARNISALLPLALCLLFASHCLRY